jgi:hypothetical protein
MFLTAFLKVAALTATVSPEAYFEHVHEKDPYIGAAVGGKAGLLAGAIKGKKGGKAKAALIGEILGSIGGAGAGHGVKKVMQKYHAHKLRGYAEDLNLRATPHRGYGHHES